MKLYKLVSRLYSGAIYHTEWQFGVAAKELSSWPICSRTWYYGYIHPLLAAFFRLAHVPSYDTLLEGEGKIGYIDAAKVGMTVFTPEREVPLPVITIEQFVEIGIRVSLLLPQSNAYREWAEDWLSGKDRTVKTARRMWVENSLRWNEAWGSMEARVPETVVLAAARMEDWPLQAAEAAVLAVCVVHHIAVDVILGIIQEVVNKAGCSSGNISN